MNTSKPISVQLYTVREQVKELGFQKILEKVASYGYAGVEFAGYGGHTAEEVAGFLKDFGLKASSTHGKLPTKEHLQPALDDAARFGYTTHITGFGREHFSDAEKMQEPIGWLKEAVAATEGTPLQVGMHNHEFEFDKLIDGKLPHELVRDAVPGLYFQLDTYWVETGMRILGEGSGYSLPGLLEAYGERVKNPHIKDGPAVRGEPMVAVGKGSMDWKGVFAAMPETVDWLVVELDHCATDMLEAVEESYKFLTGEGYATGTK
ncbi:MAG: sugar phosphate isomerase/epimerase family protein [Opitutales bacterium]